MVAAAAGSTIAAADQQKPCCRGSGTSSLQHVVRDGSNHPAAAAAAAAAWLAGWLDLQYGPAVVYMPTMKDMKRVHTSCTITAFTCHGHHLERHTNMALTRLEPAY